MFLLARTRLICFLFIIACRVGGSMELQRKKDGAIQIKSKVFLRFAILFVVLCVAGLALSYFGRFFYLSKTTSNSTTHSLYQLWQEQNYARVYETASVILENNFLNNAALAFKGFAAFYLAVSNNVPSESQQYLEEAINALQLAQRGASVSSLPQIHYMLGKSYFLAARSAGYTADDIPEYLGLCYASLGMTDESISAFTEALLVRESDTLLLAIAEQYYKNQQYAAARQYLFRVNEKSTADDIVIRSNILLGNVAVAEEDFDTAQQKFSLVLEKDPNSADACYGLGIIYEAKGDLVRARAEWRKALRIQVNHSGALKKLAEYK